MGQANDLTTGLVCDGPHDEGSCASFLLLGIPAVHEHNALKPFVPNGLAQRVAADEWVWRACLEFDFVLG